MPLQIERKLDPLADVHVTLYSPPGEGKTWAAASASDFFPEKFPIEQPVELKDTMWILFDKGGLAGLNEQKVIVPKLDLSSISGKELIDALREIPTILRPEVKNGLRYVVGDTITVLDIGLLAYYLERYDKWDLYNAILKDHRVFFDGIRGLKLRAIWIFHEKYQMKAGDSAAAQQTAAAAAAKGVELGKSAIDISGRAMNFYRGQSSLILPVKKIRAGTGENDFQYYVLPRSNEKDCKTRYKCLANREPANLRALFKKIEQASGVSAA